MKRAAFVVMMMLMIAFLAGTAFTALEKEMSIQVAEAQLRAAPAYYGAVVGAVSYADRLKILDTKGSWVKASHPKIKAAGWIHVSALTSQKLAPKSGRAGAPTSVSSGELSVAEKGFTEEVERDYRQKNREVDFTWVDRIEKIKVPPVQIAAFLKEGQVRPPEGGAQ